MSAELKKEMSENKDGSKSGSFIEQRGRYGDPFLLKLNYDFAEWSLLMISGGAITN